MTEAELDLARRWLSMARDAGGWRTSEEFTISGDIGLDSQVATDLLNTVHSALPWWGMTDEHGQTKLTRSIGAIKNRPIQLMPRHLLTINWADSGPGFSWPEAYYVVHVPQLDVRIVTASRDSTDVTGYLDLAIGWCRPQRDLAWGTKRIIVDWWRRSSGCEPMPWAEVLVEGAISEDRAVRWRKELWGIGRQWM